MWKRGDNISQEIIDETIKELQKYKRNDDFIFEGKIDELEYQWQVCSVEVEKLCKSLESCTELIKKRIMEEKQFKVNISKWYEIDREKSTFENIVFKRVEKDIKRWSDLIGLMVPIGSTFFDGDSFSKIADDVEFEDSSKGTFIDEKHAKSALAMAQISQLMPYYGGAITDEGWCDYTCKYTIARMEDHYIKGTANFTYNFLAFHKEGQRDMFLKNNEQLVKDYLMI